MKLNDPKKKSLYSLMYENSIFNIPQYQRRYGWDYIQWGKMIEDISEFLINFSEKQPIDNIYYFGQIVLHKNKDNEKDIVDGQQRLTTYSLLIFSFLNHFEKNKSKYPNISELDLNGLYQCLKKIDNIKYYDNINFENNLYLNSHQKIKHVAKSDSRNYRNVINNLGKNINSNMHKAKNFFSEWIKEKITCEEDFFNLKEIIISKISVVVIEIDELEDVFQLFETINDSGLKLSVGDLLKNEIMRKYFVLSKRNNIKIPTYTIDSEWENNIEIPFKKSVDKFLMNFFIACYGKYQSKDINSDKEFPVTKANLFKFYKSILKSINDLSKFDSWVKELYEAAKIYDLLLNSSEDKWKIKTSKNYKKLDTFLKEINLLSIGQIYPLILSYKPWTFKENDHYKWLNIYETLSPIFNFMFRTIVVKGSSPSWIEPKIYELINNNRKKIKENNNLLSFDEICKTEWLKDNSKEIVEFAQLLSKTLFIRNNEMKFIHRRYLNHLKQDEDVVEIKDDLDVEHIFPQKPHEDWKKVFEWSELINSKDSESKLGKYKYSIGNTTLISPSKNKKVSNFSWSHKKDNYFHDDETKAIYFFKIDKTLEEFKYKNQLLPDDIQQRTIKVTEYLINKKIFSIFPDENEVKYDKHNNKFELK